MGLLLSGLQAGGVFVERFFRADMAGKWQQDSKKYQK
jgi:hypothetical protein